MHVGHDSRSAPSYQASSGKLAVFVKASIRGCVRTAGVGCVSAAPRVGTRQECQGSLRGFGLGLESGRHGVPHLPGLRPDGWDCHSPADVKDHAPQDITIGTPLLYHKIVLRGAVELRRHACLTGKNCDTILLLYRMKGLTWQT